MSLLTASAITKSLFALDLPTFLGLTKAGFNNPNTTSSYGNTYEVSLKELFDKGGTGIPTYPLSTAMKRNLKEFGLNQLLMIAGTKAGLRVAKEFGVMRNLNKLVRQVGLGKVVKF